MPSWNRPERSSDLLLAFISMDILGMKTIWNTQIQSVGRVQSFSILRHVVCIITTRFKIVKKENYFVSKCVGV
jgi:hypothetical protein